MIVGVPRETKPDEHRVALRPVDAALLVADGHEVLIEAGAGEPSGFPDEAYRAGGCREVEGPDAIFERAELIVKVKEPQAAEVGRFRAGQVVACYFHFAASRELTEACLKAGVTAIAYETLGDASGGLPLLTPMSEVAGRMSVQQGAKYLERPAGGRGVLLSGVPGVEPGRVLVLGAGVVGANAARLAAGLGAHVVLMDIRLDRLRELAQVMPPNVATVYADPDAIERQLERADLVIGAVLVPGGRAPHLVSEAQVQRIGAGAVVVDVCIDQGGCVQTSRPTTHRDPVFRRHDVVHYCVTNMPGAVGRTSTPAMCNATAPYVRQLARLGVDAFLGQSEGHAAALNLRRGRIACRAVAETFPDLPAD